MEQIPKKGDQIKVLSIPETLSEYAQGSVSGHISEIDEIDDGWYVAFFKEKEINFMLEVIEADEEDDEDDEETVYYFGVEWNVELDEDQILNENDDFRETISLNGQTFTYLFDEEDDELIMVIYQNEKGLYLKIIFWFDEDGWEAYLFDEITENDFELMP